jgi:cytoskeletal protein CcmA (bactofilin family)
MSKSNDQEQAGLRPESVPEKIARLGPTFVCQGEISAEEDLHILGTFKGIIRLKNCSLFIDKSAQVEADILAGNVSLLGSLKGSIQATGKVFLSSEAKMRGNIASAKVTIQDGAQFRGSIKIEQSGP